jgi:hypothetical protein
MSPIAGEDGTPKPSNFLDNMGGPVASPGWVDF